MDVAGTFFFANLTTILIALQDKSVSFHFANNLNFDELDNFAFSPEKNKMLYFFFSKSTYILHEKNYFLMFATILNKIEIEMLNNFRFLPSQFCVAFMKWHMQLCVSFLSKSLVGL